MISVSPRCSFIRFAIAGVVALTLLWLVYRAFAGQSFSGAPHLVIGDEVPATNPLKLQSIPLVHKNVVVASGFGAHFDVYLAVAWTLQRVMPKDQGSLQVYAPTPFFFKFQDVVDRYQLYEGEIKHFNDLLGDIKSVGEDGGIDLLILGTCEIEYVFLSPHCA